MIISTLLFRYLARKFTVTFIGFLLIALFLVYMIEILELLRRTSNSPEVTLDIIAVMGLLKTPLVGQKVIPFMILLAAMYTFWQLTLSHELIIVRAIGISVWQFMMPLLMISLLIGVVKMAVVQPLGTVFLSDYYALERRYLTNQKDVFHFPRSGLWLRQSDGDHYYFIRASSALPRYQALDNVMILQFNAQQRYVARIDTPRIVLQDHAWVITQGIRRITNRVPEPIHDLRIATDLTFQQIKESLDRPEEVSFWTLPYFFKSLEHAGFSSTHYRLYYQDLWAQPWLYCLMVILAAIFSLRLPRRGGTLILIVSGIGISMGIFTLTKIVSSLALNNILPIVMAVWGPIILFSLAGIIILLHVEDG